MSTTAPTHFLMDRLLRELDLRNVRVNPEAQEAIEREFFRRLSRSTNPDAVVEAWSRNFQRYLDLLDQVARHARKNKGMSDGADVELGIGEVQPTFAICATLCPGPA